MADFTVEGIISVDVSRGIRDLKRFSKQSEKTWADLEALEHKIEDLDGERIRLDIEANEDKIRQVKEDLKTIGDEKVKIDIEVDEMEWSPEQLRDTLNEIDDIVIDANLDASKAIRDAQKLSAELEALDNLDFNIHADVDNGAEVIAEVERINAEIDAALDEHKQVKIDVDRSAIDGLTDAVREATGSIGAPGMGGTLVGGLGILATALVPMAATVAAAGAGMVGAFGTAATAAAALGAVAAPTFKEMGEAIKKIDKAVEGLEGPAKWKAINKELKNVDPSIRPGVRAIYDFKKAWEEASNSVKPEIMGAVVKAMDFFTVGVQKMAPIAGVAATAIGKLFTQMKKGIQGEEWTKFFDYMEEELPWFIDTWGKTMGNFITGFANMIRAFDPLTKFFSGGLLRMSESFREWSNNLENSKGFQKFVEFFRTNGPTVLDFFKQLVIAAVNLGVALAPMGVKVLEQVTAWLKAYNAWTKANPEAGKLVAKMFALAAGVIALAGPIGSIVGPLFKFGGALAKIPALGGLVGGLGGLLAVMVGLSAVIPFLNTDTKEFGELWKSLKDTWETIKDTGTRIWEMLQDMWDIFKDSGAIENFQTAWKDLVDAFRPFIPILEPIATLMAGTLLTAVWALSWAFRGLAMAVKGIVEPFAWAVEKGVALFQWLYDKLIGHSIVPDLINGIGKWFRKLPGIIGGALLGLPGKVGEKFNELKNKALDKLSQLKQSASDKLGQLKASMSEKFNSMKSTAKQKVSELVTNGISKFQDFKSKASTKFNEIKTSVTTKLSEMKQKGVTKLQEFKTGAIEKISNFLSTTRQKMSTVKGIITGAFSGAGSWLTSAGRSIMGGLAAGLRAGKNAVGSAMSGIGSYIGRYVPGSPVKEGPLKQFNDGTPGKKLMEMFAGGIMAANAPQDAMEKQLGFSIGDTMGRSWGSLTRTSDDALAGITTSAMGSVTNIYEITVEVPVGASLVEAGRQTVRAIEAYEQSGGRKKRK